MNFRELSVIVVLACAMGSALAKEEVKQVVKADTPEAFQQVVDKIHGDMESGGRYEFTKPTDKQEITRKLTEMLTLLQKSGTVAAMDEADRVTLYNDQEKINGMLTHNDRERLVCERAAPVGSLIPVTKCRTYGEIERSRRSAELGSQFTQNHAGAPKGNGDYSDFLNSPTTPGQMPYHAGH